ncbi:hypothetical protein IPZ70_12720 [Streptomyces polychromogenes]|nr:hypothetical protein [Streptomyces polychromogenes]
MSDTNRQDDWQAGVLGELTGTGPSRGPATPPPGDGHRAGTTPPTVPVPPQPQSSGGQAYAAPGGQAAHGGDGQGQWPGGAGQGGAAREPGRPYAQPQAAQTHAQPGHAQSDAQAGYAQPGQAQPEHAQPGHAQPGYAQSGHAQPGYAQPGHAQPGYAQSGHAQPGYGQPGQAQPEHAQSGHEQSPYVQPGQEQPEHDQFAYAQSAHAQPGHAQPHAARRAAPETVPVLGADAPVGRSRHGDPLMRRTLRSLRGALGSSAAKAVASETGLATQVQQPVTTGRHIVVTSIRGGSGKTTVTALLSRTYNHFRHDPVLTLEADAALGTLPVRLGVESLRWTCGDLAQIVRPSMQLTDITGYLVPLPDGGWLLPGSQGRIGAQVDVATYRTVMVALRRYFGVTVVDCETLPGEVARTALDTAHARVLTTPATAEGLVSTHAVLDWLASLPVPVLPRTVVVLTVQSPHPAVDLAKATAKLAATGAGVVVLPYDRHLASGGAVRTDLLGEGTRQATVRLAAEVLQRAVALPAAGGAR